MKIYVAISEEPFFPIMISDSWHRQSNLFFLGLAPNAFWKRALQMFTVFAYKEYDSKTTLYFKWRWLVMCRYKKQYCAQISIYVMCYLHTLILCKLPVRIISFCAYINHSPFYTGMKDSAFCSILIRVPQYLNKGLCWLCRLINSLCQYRVNFVSNCTPLNAHIHYQVIYSLSPFSGTSGDQLTLGDSWEFLVYTAYMGSLCHFTVAWCTLREWHRSQNCDNDGTITITQ